VKNAKTLQDMESSQGLQDLFARDSYNPENNDHIGVRQEHNTNPKEEQKDPANLDDNGDDFSLESPKSRVSSEEGKGSAHQENSVKSSENILFHEEDISERVEDNVSSSCFHASDDEVKPVEESCLQKSPIEPQQHLQTTKLLSNKKNKKKQAVQKEPWSHITKGVLTIWKAIKFAIQRGESEEEMRQNKNTPSNWKPILDPEYEHRKLFLAFLSSECSIGFNE
jgi:hypothetical protein